jgi:hypothetical protein
LASFILHWEVVKKYLTELRRIKTHQDKNACANNESDLLVSYMGIGGMTFTGSMMRSIDLALGGRASQAKDFEVRDLII